MRRLLVILPTNGHGGCEYGALSFAKHCRDTDAFDVVIAVPERDETVFVHELCRAHGLPVVVLGAGFEADDDAPRLAAQEAAAAALIRVHRPDIVFVAMPWPARGTGLVTALASADVPTVVKFALVPETLYGPPPEMLPRLRAARARRQLWFANSRESAALLEGHFGLLDGQVEHFPVAPLGLSALCPEPSPPLSPIETRRRLGVPEDRMVAVTVGRLAEQKGYSVLLEAVAGLHPEKIGLHFLWVGEGELRPVLEAQIASCGLGASVTLAGFRREVRSLLRASDLFILPSLYEGGSSQAMLEALAEGLPVIASRLPGVVEAVRDGEEALLVPPGEPEPLARAIKRLAGDAGLRERLGSAGKRVSQNYTAEAMYAATRDRLERAMAFTKPMPARLERSRDQWLSWLTGRLSSLVRRRS